MIYACVVCSMWDIHLQEYIDDEEYTMVAFPEGTDIDLVLRLMGGKQLYCGDKPYEIETGAYTEIDYEYALRKYDLTDEIKRFVFEEEQRLLAESMDKLF